MSESRSTQASSYESGNETQKDMGIELINMLEIAEGSTILDLGCGTGTLAKVLSEIVGGPGSVVAVDPDEERLQIAREKYSTDNIEYLTGDDRTFPNGQYDLVFSNAAIQWVPNKESLFKRVYENLRPGGRFAFTTADGEFAIPAIGKRFFDEVIDPNFLNHFFSEVAVFVPADQYKDLASATGFQQAQLTVSDTYLEWRDLDHYIDMMYGWFGGNFEPSQFDTNALSRLKEEYGSGPVVQTNPLKLMTAIFTKPHAA